ncbi:MAG: tRNA 2-thiouridine(34) synthase MnmA [Candidatus Magasanikbacteria bacterium RIFCSPLOWO2_12_FULL_47_9b]|nr:MAG: tRNA 2-thiouridine(34) synthase MnmA [Candidatus Magasanikbacteria bacterium RIFCSPLOWO2_02_FULL_47_16]OGH80077.1 MAG: tRNA 2-thiouridine(34) synthase MnmA [Candidatus Magasanikbacteria bacterium RIFCSPHIGHO2_02_FULL_48_18]OGH83338.1 MAG: tRNA 2-thiouridine(34) synthase MnmA [Candidatus Magasanikbacteria bacterium RIFCSPLOWO2_12_FULL_47_9b]
MSGGVDSSVAAALLIRDGHDVAGAFMIQYDDRTDSSREAAVSCWKDDYRDALRVAATLGIPLFRFDFIKEYETHVLRYLFAEYTAGRTPNPDVLCNTYLKFGIWLKKARELGYDALATGHYAMIEEARQKGKMFFHLAIPKDKNKDQTYFLHQLSQEQLSSVLFPIGGYTKKQVRALARRFHLPTANRPESMGICFVGEKPMKAFLEKRIPKKPGKVVSSDGTRLGTHDGLSFYTIGERHAHIAWGRPSLLRGNHKTDPLYVVQKRAKTNELVLGSADDPLLYVRDILISDPHWIFGQAPSFPVYCTVRLRHRQALQKATIREDDGTFLVSCALPQRAVTPGQFAVFYQKGRCLGGGVISEIQEII